MGFVKTKDGVEIHYKGWGKGQPIVFSHGPPRRCCAGSDEQAFLDSIAP